MSGFSPNPPTAFNPRRTILNAARRSRQFASAQRCLREPTPTSGRRSTWPQVRFSTATCYRRINHGPTSESCNRRSDRSRAPSAARNWQIITSMLSKLAEGEEDKAMEVMLELGTKICTSKGNLHWASTFLDITAWFWESLPCCQRNGTNAKVHKPS